jgi:hypothetical protein
MKQFDVIISGLHCRINKYEALNHPCDYEKKLITILKEQRDMKEVIHV